MDIFDTYGNQIAASLPRCMLPSTTVLLPGTSAGISAGRWCCICHGTFTLSSGATGVLGLALVKRSRGMGVGAGGWTVARGGSRLLAPGVDLRRADLTETGVAKRLCNKRATVFHAGDVVDGR